MLIHVGVCILFAGCHMGASSDSAQQNATVRHLVGVDRRGASLYIDRVDNRAVLKMTQNSGKTEFCSFLVGFRDSSIVSGNKEALAAEKYFQYDMQNNWIALVNGDSLHPVFFQQRPGLDAQLKEGVMVFEVPLGIRPDTLVYKDSFGSWGTNFFVLNRK